MLKPMKWFFLLLASSLCALEIQLGNQILDVEIADRAELRAKGLSGRRSLADGTGMLFVFDRPEICSFWMKDTHIPLSIGFFDEKKKLTQWVDMPLLKKKNGEIPTYKSAKPALYALEVPIGWFQEHQIELGAIFHWIESAP